MRGASERSLWRLVSVLCVLTACTSAKDDDSTTSSRPALDNYGEGLIGYKGGRGGRESPTSDDGDLNAGPTAGDEPTGDGWDGTSSDGADALPWEPWDAGPDAGGDDAGSDAGVADAGMDDAGVADAGDPPPAALPKDTGERPPDAPENPFFATSEEPTSTFGLDVDTGAYTLARAAISAGTLPEPRSVRIEEFLNYFHFHYAQPQAETPFALYGELADCPWNPQRKLLMLGVQGQEVKLVDQPAANLVFLIDVSGSMSESNKLPLLKQGFRMLAHQLRPQDRVSIVTYAGSDQVVLEGAHGDDPEKIIAALDQLEPSGSTNGEAGIERAYAIAQEHFIEGGNNRVLLATDGDFNVGIDTTEQLVEFIAHKRDSGVFLSVYGFGEAWDGGNYEDETMEQLADNGNGIYFYIDGPDEARRAFLSTVSGSLLTVAKDVKVQVELNPSQVKAYRLIGYENRVIANENFDDDDTDGGELGAGLSMTALYEIIPADSREDVPQDLLGTAPVIEPGTPSDDSSVEPAAAPVAEPKSASIEPSDLVQVRVRYKGRDADTSELIQQNWGRDIYRPLASPKLSFAAAVSELAIGLRGSQYTPTRPLTALLPLIDAAAPLDGEGAVAELRALVVKASELRGE